MRNNSIICDYRPIRIKLSAKKMYINVTRITTVVNTEIITCCVYRQIAE